MTNSRLYGEFTGAPTVGITGTFYDKPDARFEAALETAEGWRDKGMPLVVVDGSPENQHGKLWVPQALRERGAVVLQATVNGIASQRQEGATFALSEGAATILTHEPEKVSTPHIAGEVVRELAQSDIVVVGRTEKSLETLPPVQRYTEKLAGWILNRSYGLPEDALAGPRGYTADAAHDYLLPYPSNEPGMNNWIYMYKNLLDRMSDGGDQDTGVSGLQVDLMYPPDMTADETGNEVFDRKRYEQLRLQLAYLFDNYPVDAKAIAMAERITAELDAMGVDKSNDELETRVRNIADIATEYGYAA